MTIAQELTESIELLLRTGTSQRALDIATSAIVDCVGCIIAGSSYKATHIVSSYVRQKRAQGRSSLIGQGESAPSEDAALVNGVAAHVQDFDDISWTTMSHPSAVIAPAIIAVAEEQGSSGRELVEAYIVAYEVMSRIGAMVNPSLHLRGWHTTGILGPLAASAGACHLFKLTRQQRVNALGIAGSLAAGLKASFGTMCKPLHCGHSARIGIISASLAAAGFTSNPAVLEGDNGLISTHLGESVQPQLPASAEEWEVVVHGPVLKRFASCSASHRGMDAAVVLKDKYGIAPSDVASIRVGVSAIVLQDLKFPSPKNPTQGAFSMPFCIALALTRGKAAPSDFAEETLKDPTISDLMRKTETYLDPSIVADINTGEGATRVTITLKDGRKLEEYVSVPKGHPDLPLTREEIETKFMNNASPCLGRDRAYELLQLLQDLPDLDCVARLTPYLLG